MILMTADFIHRQYSRVSMFANSIT